MTGLDEYLTFISIGYEGFPIPSLIPSIINSAANDENIKINMETINAKYFPINTFSLETGCISNNFIVDSSISLEIISLDNITIRIIIYFV